MKGALKAGAVAGSSVTADYDSLAGGTKLNISVKSGDKYVDGSTRSIWGDTAGADTMNITVDNAVINLGSGNDFVTVSDSYSSIDAIYLNSPAANCTINGDANGDSIFNNSNGNVFRYSGNVCL